MKITSVKAQVKNPERVSVFVDGKYSFSLSLDQLLTEQLKAGIEIDSTKLKVLKKKSEDGKLKARTFEWLLNRPHSERELRDYLYRKKVEKELIEQLVSEFQQQGYQSDEQFTRWFVENRRRKLRSNRAIEGELRQKGIDRVTIQSIVTPEGEGILDEAPNRLALRATITKLRQRPRYQDPKKLIEYLLRRGFSYSLVKEELALIDEEA